MNSDDYYEILEIPESANQREIKIAYRRLARKYHPDRNSKVSDDLMKNINIAFETLSDLQKRKEYDKKLKKIDSKINEGGFGNTPYNPDQIDPEWDSDPVASAYTNTVNDKYHIPEKYVSSEDNNNNNNNETINPDEIQELQNKNLGLFVSRYQIIVEPSLCLAFGSCEVLAPKVFVVEKERQFNPKAIVISETAEDFETILDAAKTCPTKAIIIIDRYTGNRVFP